MNILTTTLVTTASRPSRTLAISLLTMFSSLSLESA